MNKRVGIIIVVLVVIGLLATAGVALAADGARAIRTRAMLADTETVGQCDQLRERLCDGTGVNCDGECDGECDGVGRGGEAGACDEETCAGDQDRVCAGGGQGVGDATGSVQGGGGRGRGGSCGR